MVTDWFMHSTIYDHLTAPYKQRNTLGRRRYFILPTTYVMNSITSCTSEHTYGLFLLHFLKRDLHKLCSQRVISELECLAFSRCIRH
jgi:hypothetical protein